MIMLTIDHLHQSPNHSSRLGRAVSMIVLHATAGSYAGALAWLCNPASNVSSHYLIRKDGHIAQLVADNLCAWHAGQASWHGQTAINEISIGIELENANNGRDPYSAVQLAACHALCREKIAHYGILRGNIVRHLDVAIPAGRKTDPKGLAWPAFADSLY
jgi:N-acetylmuramoyl-L-alanine amidase